ncbi:glycosyltransferase family 2 protein [Brevibacillus choshinensis]|uniref:Glycosyltransferase n=1 Tax=Brevibacillus choshinensis TaxID=54911 RepID=A0ABX7FX24_BRECH|nr:glycosyltransferase [Brevibacillus choshinensis]QRG70347.1 glycosyltransferase [Brevibacillus choshinensis]
MDNFLVERPEVSVVIPLNEDTNVLRQLLENIKQLNLTAEVIVVCPASARISVPQAHSSWVHVIPTDSSQTYDDSRAQGAYHAKGDVVLFLDERAIVAPALLKKYVTDIQNGADIVLTGAEPVRANKRLNPPRNAYRLLNHLLGLHELGSSTMSKIPYACNRKALEILGHDGLRTPPLGLVRAVEAKLKIVKVSPLPAIAWSRDLQGIGKKGTRQILQDHAIAIQSILQVVGKRGGLPDGERYRGLLKVPGQLHLRSAFYPQPKDDRGGKWGAKQKKKRTHVRKKK